MKNKKLEQIVNISVGGLKVAAASGIVYAALNYTSSPVIEAYEGLFDYLYWAGMGLIITFFLADGIDQLTNYSISKKLHV